MTANSPKGTRDSFGSITKRKNRKGKTQYRFQYSYNGARYSSKKYGAGDFATLSAAETQRTAVERAIHLGVWEKEFGDEKPKPADTHTLEDAWDSFTKHRTKPLASSTTRNYLQLWEGYILKHWDRETDVTKITVTEVWDFIDTVLQGKRKRDKEALNLLKSILKHCVSMEWLIRNPAEHAKMEVAELEGAHPKEYLPVEELVQYLERAPRHRALLATLALTGLRMGEACALRREDINLKAHTISVTRAVDRGKNLQGEYVQGFKEPKTQSGKREVSIPDELVTILADHLKAHPKLPKALMFPAVKTGGIMGTKEVGDAHRDALAAIGKCRSVAELTRIERKLKKEDLPKETRKKRMDEARAPLDGSSALPRPHDLRASVAKLLKDRGVGDAEIMKHLGWTDPAMLHRVYARFDRKQVAQAGSIVSEALKAAQG